MNTPAKLKKADVEQLIAYFNNTTEFPPDDPIAMARLAVSFERFAKAVAAGNVDDGKAAELAASFVLFGNQWLQSHPEVQIAKARLWTFDRVKQAIAYFNDTAAVPEGDSAWSPSTTRSWPIFGRAGSKTTTPKASPPSSKRSPTPGSKRTGRSSAAPKVAPALADAHVSRRYAGIDTACSRD